MKLQFHICDMRREQIFADGFDFPDDPFVLFENIKQLIVVHFELFFLKKDNSSTLRDRDTLSIQALCFSDKLHDVDIKINI